VGNLSVFSSRGIGNLVGLNFDSRQADGGFVRTVKKVPIDGKDVSVENVIDY